MTDKQLTKVLTMTSLILGLPALVFSIVGYFRDLPMYWTILIGTVFIVGLNLYFKFSLKKSPKGDGVEVPQFPVIYKSRLALYSLFIIPTISIVFCIILYFIGSSEGAEGVHLKISFQEEDSPCVSRDFVRRSICVAKFSPEAFDGFSQSLILDLSGKIDENELRLIDHDKFVYSGRNEKQQVDSIRYMHCIDSGIIVHGMRSSEDSVFYCKVHFLNFDRNDTLIANPNQVEFSYKGHVKFLSDFLLAHNRSGQDDYRSALNLFLEARNIDGTDEFRAVVDYYIGNTYLQLNQLDSARMFYDLAVGIPSVVSDYAREKLQDIGSEREKVILGENGVLKGVHSSVLDVERIKIISMFNAQFRSYASQFFKVRRRHEDSVKYGEFVGITANSWDPKKSSSFSSKWIILRYDSLYHFEMSTWVNNEPSGELSFKSRLSKKWSISTKSLFHIDFTLRSIQGYKPAGWNVRFKGIDNSGRMSEKIVSYDYLYSSAIARNDPRQKLNYSFVRSETERVENVDALLRRLLDRYKIRYNLKNNIEVDDLEL